jgi:hypothetical protein
MKGVVVQSAGAVAAVVADGGKAGVVARGAQSPTAPSADELPEAGVVAIGNGRGVAALAGAPLSALSGITPVAVEAVTNGDGAIAVLATAVGGRQANALYGAVDDGVAVNAQASGVAAIGVLTHAAQGTSLFVDGIAAFTQAGIGTFAVGKRVARIKGRKASSASGVLVTLNQPAGPGVSISRAFVRKDGTVVVRLNRPATREASFTFFVIDEAQPD